MRTPFFGDADRGVLVYLVIFPKLSPDFQELFRCVFLQVRNSMAAKLPGLPGRGQALTGLPEFVRVIFIWAFRPLPFFLFMTT